ncbi:DUF3788 domain-containing protein [Clostridium sp. LP20]|uniref:DUF3788 domain-containing protein n=1 Tax=Clostridium sp. LP20 TaxID=3418665 RepID=UPI003EE7C8D7
MIDIQNYNYCPDIDEIREYIRNPLFDDFFSEIIKEYNAKYKVDFSKCSWEPGWNIKFKKSGKTLCTVYPKENYFTVLVVVGTKEKEIIEELLFNLSPVIQRIYNETKEGMGQRWLMIDLEDKDKIFTDVLKLIDIRAKAR